MSEEDQDSSMLMHLTSCLTSVTSPDQAVRNNGEKELKLLEVTEDFGVHLTKITVDPSTDIAIRQLSSLILKQYVMEHWCNISEKFSPPETTEFAKTAIRQMLPLGLRDEHRKVRVSVAYAISAIAGWDWPENWPGLLDSLMEALKISEPHCVHGAMRVLTEFVRDLTDIHMIKVIPILFPEMFRILLQQDSYSIGTRTRAVSIFNTCAGLIHAIAGSEKNALKVVLNPYLGQFIDAFVEILKCDNNTDIRSSQLKKEIIKSLNNLLKSFPKEMKSSMNKILPVVWKTLTCGAEYYIEHDVNDADADQSEVDSDGEVIGFGPVVYGLFDLIDTMLEHRQFRLMIKNALEDLMYYLILYMEIKEEQINTWMENPDQFVEDEDDDTFSYGVRISSQDLFLTCCREFKQASSVAMFKAVEKHITQASQARDANNPYWWKAYEASMLALGSVQSLVVESIQKKQPIFDINVFLMSVVLPSMKVSEAPFLVGRALWIASRFSELIEPPLLKQLIETTVQGLQENQLPPVRICAVRAVFSYCEHLKNSNSTHILAPYIVPLFEGLVHLALQAAIETLALVLETLRVVLTVDDDATAQFEPKISPLALAVFLKHSNDPLIVSLSTDIFEVLASKEQCNKFVLDRLIPTFLSIFNGPPDKISPNLVSITMELLCTVVRNTKPPLPEVLVSEVFPAVVTSIVQTDDNSVIQSGGDCIRAFLSVSSAQISNWKDSEGVSGLHYVLQVVSHLLDPKLSEYTASFVGRLVSVLIRECGANLSTVLDQLLRAVLSKLQQTQTLSVAQSLLVIFANLFNHEFLPTLEFLCSVPGPSGNTALDFVMSEWCEKQHLFFGSYESKICMMALSKIFQHVVTTNDNRINEIKVKGDQIFSESQVIRTRSKAKNEPEKWTTVPLPIKLLKMLIMELGNASEAAEAKSLDDDEDNDDENEEWEDDNSEQELGSGDASRMTLSELLDSVNEGLCRDDYSEGEEDPDALADPISNVNAKEYLTNYLTEFCTSPIFSQHFSPHLNNNERNILHAIGISR